MAIVAHTCAEWKWAGESPDDITTSSYIWHRFNLPVDSAGRLGDLWMDARSSLLIQTNWMQNHIQGGNFSGLPAFRPFATALVSSLFLSHATFFHFPIAGLCRAVCPAGGDGRPSANNKADCAAQWAVYECLGCFDPYPPWVDSPTYAYWFEQENHQLLCAPAVGLGV